ncbi:MAG: hypothetical protein V4723_05170 [Pseudomonadota bacterium]
MFHKTGPSIEHIGDHALVVRCPPAFQGLHYHLMAVGFLVFVGAKNWRNANVLELLVMGVILLVFAALIYRNTVHRDELAVFKDAAAPEPGRLDFCCAEISGVEVEPEPGWMSYRWRMANFGLGRGSVLIHTDSGQHHFGIGLPEAQAQQVAREILTFCGQGTQHPHTRSD